MNQDYDLDIPQNRHTCPLPVSLIAHRHAHLSRAKTAPQPSRTARDAHQAITTKANTMKVSFRCGFERERCVPCPLFLPLLSSSHTHIFF